MIILTKKHLQIHYNIKIYVKISSNLKEREMNTYCSLTSYLQAAPSSSLAGFGVRRSVRRQTTDWAKQGQAHSFYNVWKHTKPRNFIGRSVRQSHTHTMTSVIIGCLRTKTHQIWHCFCCICLRFQCDLEHVTLNNLTLKTKASTAKLMPDSNSTPSNWPYTWLRRNSEIFDPPPTEGQ